MMMLNLPHDFPKVLNLEANSWFPRETVPSEAPNLEFWGYYTN